jgi:hypothetical protein
MPKPMRHWSRKHLKGTEVFIDCQACQDHSVTFIHVFKGDTSTRACHARDKYTGLSVNKSLDYWGYANAPSWCVRRKANGGML